jgi:hypothetical protein
MSGIRIQLDGDRLHAFVAISRERQEVLTERQNAVARLIGHDEEEDEPEEDEPEEEEQAETPPFSVHALVDRSGPGIIARLIRFTSDEFLDLFELCSASLQQTGRGRRRSIAPIDAFFVFMLALTSGNTLREIAAQYRDE